MRQQFFGRVAYCAILAASLYIAFLVGVPESSGASVLAAFTLVLLSAAFWLHVESTSEARRWFALGAVSGIAASLVLMLLCGPGIHAFNLLGKFSQNELGPMLYSPVGSVVLTAWLALLSGLAGGAFGFLRSRRPGVPIGLVWFLMIVGFLWLRTLAAHERPAHDSIEQVAEGP